MEKPVEKADEVEDNDVTVHDAKHPPSYSATFATPMDPSPSFMHLALPLLDSPPVDGSFGMSSFVYVGDNPPSCPSLIGIPGF